MTKSYRKIYSTGRALSREREKRQAVAKAKEGGEEEKVVTCDHTPAAHQWITMSHSCDYRVLYPSHSRQVHRGLPRLFPTSRRNCRSSRSPFLSIQTPSGLVVQARSLDEDYSKQFNNKRDKTRCDLLVHQSRLCLAKSSRCSWDNAATKVRVPSMLRKGCAESNMKLLKWVLYIGSGFALSTAFQRKVSWKIGPLRVAIARTCSFTRLTTNTTYLAPSWSIWNLEYAGPISVDHRLNFNQCGLGH